MTVSKDGGGGGGSKSDASFFAFSLARSQKYICQKHTVHLFLNNVCFIDIYVLR